jgi:cytochrome c oxidase subunit II
MRRLVFFRRNMLKRVCGFSAPLFAVLLSACVEASISPAGTQSALDPRGPAAARLAELWWVMFAFGAFVFVLVLVLLFAALLRRRRATEETPPENHNDTGRKWLIWGGIVLPLWILAIVFWYNIYTLSTVATAPEDEETLIQIVGRRWWWEVHYRDLGITTANELHIPVGQPVHIKLESGDVIHSFWVPQLHGKMDLIPTRANYITIQADEPGIYRGRCAEFCGLQHAHMGFIVVAESQEEFDAWIAAQQQPTVTPVDELALRGQEVFLSAGCAYCHSINGLDDSSVDASEIDLGPDLTHVGSRLTIAAGSLTNNLGNLAGWILDAQHVKPGSLMPPMYLNSQDLQALLAYIDQLR